MTRLPPSGCRLKAPPGEAGIAARRLGRDPLIRTLSPTDEVAALLTSRRWFTEASHEAHKHVFFAQRSRGDLPGGGLLSIAWGVSADARRSWANDGEIHA